MFLSRWFGPSSVLQAEFLEPDKQGTAVDTTFLMWGFLFSTIGLGFFMYGKKQKALVPLVSGLVLMIYPYLMPNSLWTVVVGVVLVAVPYFVRF